jgi:hypothetical protein
MPCVLQGERVSLSALGLLMLCMLRSELGLRYGKVDHMYGGVRWLYAGCGMSAVRCLLCLLCCGSYAHAAYQGSIKALLRLCSG